MQKKATLTSLSVALPVDRHVDPSGLLGVAAVMGRAHARCTLWSVRNAVRIPPCPFNRVETVQSTAAIATVNRVDDHQAETDTRSLLREAIIASLNFHDRN